MIIINEDQLGELFSPKIESKARLSKLENFESEKRLCLYDLSEHFSGQKFYNCKYRATEEGSPTALKIFLCKDTFLNTRSKNTFYKT